MYVYKAATMVSEMESSGMHSDEDASVCSSTNQGSNADDKGSDALDEADDESMECSSNEEKDSDYSDKEIDESTEDEGDGTGPSKRDDDGT